MITLQDLDTAIARCQGESNPNANTCIKLAAFYTIRQEMFGEAEKSVVIPAMSGYSTQQLPSPTTERAEKIIDYDSGTEFSAIINGADAFSVWEVMDELMTVLQATNPRLYDGVLRKIQKI